MKVLVTYAVEAEFARCRTLRNLETLKVGNVGVHRAQIGRAVTDFVVTGMGAENARSACEAVMSDDYSLCIATGFSGALKEELKPGAIIAPEQVLSRATGKRTDSGRNLMHAAVRDGATRINTLLTVDEVVKTAEEKASLAPFAEAVDMESFAILQAARAKKLTAVVIRVISDSFNQDLPVDIDTMVDKYGKVHIGNAVRYVATHPLSLPALLRLGRDSRTAAEALAHFLEAYIKKLSFATHGWPPPELQEVAAS